MLSAISNRRSIRKYLNRPVEKSAIEEILLAGCLAPSSKNRQPWKFIVVMGNEKDVMIEIMKRGLEREKEHPLLPESSPYLDGAWYTLQIMAQAPAVIFIVNPLGLDIHSPLTPEQHVSELCNAQSIGAAIENMTLTATELGLGSLWICDTYFAYDELNRWLDAGGELAAAMAVGYADEAPRPRPRKPLEEITQWRI